ncbi:hypothetical protein A4G19_11540 [Pasteurellaceae bacterium Macca]|nr:hypothetical protein [Pasteurellaceae bacterium Macca]
MNDKINFSFLGTSLGYSISLLLIPMLILKTTGSPLLVSLSYALDVIPYLLFTPFIGWLGDKYNKKKIILFGELSCLILSFLIFILPYQPEFIYLLILLGAMISTFSALHHPIFQSILPELYAPDKLPTVNANIASISSMTGILAPLVIAGALSFVSEREILMVMIFCYLLSFFTFLSVKHHYQPNTQHQNIIEGMKESWAFVRQESQLKYFSYLFFFANFGLKMIFVNLIWIYSTRFHLDNSEVAYHFIVIGIMSIIGAKIAGKYLVNKYKNTTIILASFFGISVLTLSLMCYSHPLLLTITWGIVSMLSMFIVVTYFTYRQKITPQPILGKVISITRLISYLAIPPASILSGYLLKSYSNELIIYALAGLSMLITSIFFYFKLRKMP